MNKDQIETLKKADKTIKNYLRIVELCNLYRLHNESAENILKMICDIIYSENEETITIKDIKGE